MPNIFQFLSRNLGKGVAILLVLLLAGVVIRLGQPILAFVTLRDALETEGVPHAVAVLVGSLGGIAMMYAGFSVVRWIVIGGGRDRNKAALWLVVFVVLSQLPGLPGLAANFRADGSTQKFYSMAADGSIEISAVEIDRDTGQRRPRLTSEVATQWKRQQQQPSQIRDLCSTPPFKPSGQPGIFYYTTGSPSNPTFWLFDGPGTAPDGSPLQPMAAEIHDKLRAGNCRYM